MGTDDIPDSLMGFNYMLSDKGQSVDKTIHFYLDDYQFERLWNKPDTYIPMLKPYRSCLTPDFSQIDELLDRAQRGHSDNPSTLAARRILAKKNIDWKTGKSLDGKGYQPSLF